MLMAGTNGRFPHTGEGSETTVTVLPATTGTPLATADLDRVVRRLMADHPAADSDELAEMVRGIADGYRDARIVQYVAIFIEREARDQLRAAGVPRPRASADGTEDQQRRR